MAVVQVAQKSARFLRKKLKLLNITVLVSCLVVAVFSKSLLSTPDAT